jgi:hypothetical protein
MPAVGAGCEFNGVEDGGHDPSFSQFDTALKAAVDFV